MSKALPAERWLETWDAAGWSGSGTINLSGGKQEPIRCRASYDVLDEQNKLQLNINCASESYKFELLGSATYTGGAITGSWSESTRNAAGTMSGKVEGAGFQGQGTDIYRQSELGDAWGQAVSYDQVARRAGRSAGRDDQFAAWIVLPAPCQAVVKTRTYLKIEARSRSAINAE